MNKLRKALLVLERFFIKKVEYVNVPLYMRLYNNYLRRIGVKVHKDGARFIHPSVQFDGRGNEKISIGKDVVISRNVLFLVHDYSLSCGFRKIGLDAYENEAFFLKEIKIGNNVFIGANVTILPGTTIGDDCIIGAGTVIKGRYESNSIYCGNPSRKIMPLDKWANKKYIEDTYYWKKYGD